MNTAIDFLRDSIPGVIAFVVLLGALILHAKAQNNKANESKIKISFWIREDVITDGELGPLLQPSSPPKGVFVELLDKLKLAEHLDHKREDKLSRFALFDIVTIIHEKIITKENLYNSEN